MAPGHAEKPLASAHCHTATPKDIKISSQEIILKKTTFHGLRRHQAIWLSFLLLTLISLMVTLGAILATTQIHSLMKFQAEFGPFSLHIPCVGFKSSQNERYHDDKSVFGAVRQPNLKAGKLSLEVIKREASNGTGMTEELLTAPFNTPTTSISSTSISTISSSATSFITSASSPAASQKTSLSTDSSTQAFSTSANTISTQILSSSFIELTTGSPKITTLTGKFSNSDSPTSTTQDIDTLSSTNIPMPRQTIYTTTLPDGAVSTLTSITIIETEVEPSGSAIASKTRAPAGLQTNVAHGKQALPVGQLMGISGVFFAFMW